MMSSRSVERRRNDRVEVDLPVTITVRKKSYRGRVRNASLSGVCISLSTVLPKNIITFLPKASLTVRFTLSGGEKSELYCEVKWIHVHTITKRGLKCKVGLKIVSPPKEFKDFIRSLG